MAKRKLYGMPLSDQPWWIRIFVAIGILATLGAIITLFFSFGRRPSHMWATETPAVHSSDFLVALAGGVASSVESGGQARLLRNGDRFYPPMLADMRAARKTIHFTVYIWEKGRISEEIARIFAERARAGVVVRLLLDSFGSSKMPKEQIESMKKAGVKVQMFREARFGRFTRYHRRTHRRAIIIDGLVGYTGGAAVADKWLGDARNDEEWRDDMVRVTGPMARSLQSAFAELWTASNGEILVGTEIYPALPPEGGSQILHVGLSSSPTDDKHPLRLFFALSFLGARKQLYIASPYFVPDKHTRGFVAERAKKGVDVRLVIPNKKTDAKPIREATHSYFEELLTAGVRIYEYQPTMMHAKYVVVDGVWSIVGSANMDIRSKELNSENVLGILDPTFAHELEESFAADLARSKEIRLEEWRQRSAFRRFTERVAVLFVEQY
jgi:cardiolipin synthase A/B